MMRLNLPSSAKTADMYNALPIVRHSKWAKAIAVIIIAFSWTGTAKGQEVCQGTYDRDNGSSTGWKTKNDDVWLVGKYRNVGIGKLFPTAALHIGHLDDGVTERSTYNNLMNGILLESCGGKKVFLGIEEDAAILNSSDIPLGITSNS